MRGRPGALGAALVAAGCSRLPARAAAVVAAGTQHGVPVGAAVAAATTAAAGGGVARWGVAMVRAVKGAA